MEINKENVEQISIMIQSLRNSYYIDYLVKEFNIENKRVYLEDLIKEMLDNKASDTKLVLELKKEVSTIKKEFKLKEQIKKMYSFEKVAKEKILGLNLN